VARYLKLNDMKRNDKQIYTLLKSSERPLTLDEIASQSEYSRRNVERIISRLRRQSLVRGIKGVERKTVYEPIS